MNVTVAEPAQIILTNASEADRRKVGAWIDYLKRWDTDPFARQHARKLEGLDDTYMLVTNTDLRIFFTLSEGQITVLDLAKKATIVRAGQAAEAD